MAKIAVDLERALTHRREHGSPGQTMPRILARGEGWTVADVVCTCGPQDRPFEEQHDRDVSNFNRAFRTEFGMSPSAYRAHVR